jgi:hypothetical protein
MVEAGGVYGTVKKHLQAPWHSLGGLRGENPHGFRPSALPSAKLRFLKIDPPAVSLSSIEGQVVAQRRNGRNNPRADAARWPVSI